MRPCYIIYQVDRITTVLINLMNIKQCALSIKISDCIDFLFSQTVLSKLIAGNNISSSRICIQGIIIMFKYQ